MGYKITNFIYVFAIINADGSPDDIDYLETWAGMEEAKALGLARSIGVSNFNISQINRLSQHSRIPPAVNEIEMIMATHGITLPLNTVTSKIESFKVKPPELEDIQKTRTNFGSDVENNFKNVKCQLDNVNVPKIENIFESAQNIGEECVLKYAQYNKLYMPPKLEYQPVLNSPIGKPTTTESFLTKTEYLDTFSNVPLPSVFKQPLKLSSSVTSFDSSIKCPDSHKIDPCISSSIYDSSNIQQLSSPCTITSEASKSDLDLSKCIPLSSSPYTLTESTKSLLDLAKSIVASKTQFISQSVIGTNLSPPVSGLSSANVLPMFESIGTVTPCSSLPLSVTSSTNFNSHQPGLFNYFLTSFNTNGFTNSLQSSLPINNKDFMFLSSPTTLPQPSLPLLTPNCEEYVSTSSVNSQKPLKVSTSVIHYTYPTITNNAIGLTCPKVPKSSLPSALNQNSYGPVSLVSSVNLDLKSTSSLYRNCYSLQPLPLSNIPSSFNTLPLGELSSSLNVVSHGLDISQPMPKSNTFQVLSPASMPVVSVLDNKLITPPKTSLNSELEITNPYDLSSSNNLLNTLSNCLSPPSANLPISSSALNSVITKDIYSPKIDHETDLKTFKRSPSTSSKVSKNIIPAPFINSLIVNLLPIEEQVTNTNDISLTNKEKLLELINLAELLNTDDICDDKTMNKILLMLTDL